MAGSDAILLIGADPFPPYQYAGEDGAMRGSDWDTVRRTLEKAGYVSVLVLDEWGRIEKLMDAGRLDAVFQVQRTPAREAKYVFSNLLRNAVTEVVSGREDIAVTSFDEITKQGLSVGVIENYAYGEPADSLPPDLKKPFASQMELLRAVSAGETDLAIVDKGVKEHLCAAKGIPLPRVMSALSFDRPLYVAFRDSFLRDAFNENLVQNHTQYRGSI